MSDVERRPRAVLDTDVIFSRVLHELFGRLATELRLLTLIWSDELLAEAERVLRERKPMPAAAAHRWVGYLRQAFPDEQIDLHRRREVDSSRLTSDPADEHVCALAVLGRADLLVTHDRGYLSTTLGQHGVEVVAPDEILVQAIEREPQAVLDVLRSQTAVWGGGRPLGELLVALERAGASVFAERVRTRLAA